MPKRISITEAQIDRRINFLIDEARSPTSIRDQVVTMAFRVVTNWVAVGDDVSSEDLKRRCRFRSEAAHSLHHHVDRRTWCASTINEHQYPIQKSWQWMRDHAAKLTIENVKEHLARWPVVVVTKEENQLLKAHHEPFERYRAASIHVLQLQPDGSWIPRHLDVNHLE